jgi:hypothetical protein
MIRLGGSGPFQTDFKGALILLRGGVSFRFVGEEECCANIAGIRFGDGEEECCVASCAGVSFGVGEGGGVGCSLLPACRWPSSSESGVRLPKPTLQGRQRPLADLLSQLLHPAEVRPVGGVLHGNYP